MPRKREVHAERNAEIRRLRLAGWAYWALADEFDLSVSTVWGIVNKGAKRRQRCAWMSRRAARDPVWAERQRQRVRDWRAARAAV